LCRYLWALFIYKSFGLLTNLSKAWFMWGSNENVISKQRILKDVEGYTGGLDKDG